MGGELKFGNSILLGGKCALAHRPFAAAVSFDKARKRGLSVAFSSVSSRVHVRMNKYLA